MRMELGRIYILLLFDKFLGALEDINCIPCVIAHVPQTIPDPVAQVRVLEVELHKTKAPCYRRWLVVPSRSGVSPARPVQLRPRRINAVRRHTFVAIDPSPG